VLRLAILFLFPMGFIVVLKLMLRGEDGSGLGMMVIAVPGTYLTAAVLFVFFEAVHLFIKGKRILSYCNLGLLFMIIIISLLLYGGA